MIDSTHESKGDTKKTFATFLHLCSIHIAGNPCSIILSSLGFTSGGGWGDKYFICLFKRIKYLSLRYIVTLDKAEEGGGGYTSKKLIEKRENAQKKDTDEKVGQAPTRLNILQF